MKPVKNTKKNKKNNELVAEVAAIMYEKTGYDPSKEPKTVARIALKVKELMEERKKNEVTKSMVMEAIDMVRTEIMREMFREMGIDTSRMGFVNNDMRR